MIGSESHLGDPPYDRSESHLGVHDGLNGCFKLIGVVIVHGPHVRLANKVLCIRVLGEHLPRTNRWLLQPAAGPGSSTLLGPFPLCTPRLGTTLLRLPDLGQDPSAHLPGGGLAPEELVVEGAVGRAEARLQEDATVGDGFQRCWALVGESESYKELGAGGTGRIVQWLEALATMPGDPRAHSPCPSQ